MSGVQEVRFPANLAYGATGGPEFATTVVAISAGPVTPPHRAGFGTELIRRAFSFELDGTADLAFEPEGLRLEATVPLA